MHRAGLDRVQALLPGPGATPTELAAAVASVSGELGLEPIVVR